MKKYFLLTLITTLLLPALAADDTANFQNSVTLSPQPKEVAAIKRLRSNLAQLLTGLITDTSKSNWDKINIRLKQDYLQIFRETKALLPADFQEMEKSSPAEFGSNGDGVPPLYEADKSNFLRRVFMLHDRLSEIQEGPKNNQLDDKSVPTNNNAQQ